MEQLGDDTTSDLPHMYIVTPTVKAMRVPVLRDPSQGDDVLTYLKANTMIDVQSRSSLWLCIQLPGNQKGYIQATLARPATSDEIRTVQATTKPGAVRQNPASFMATQVGMSSPMRRGPNFSIAFGLLTVAFGSCALAMLISTVVKNTCQAGATMCMSSQGGMVTAGVVLFVVCVLFLLFAFIASIVSIVQSRRTS